MREVSAEPVDTVLSLGGMGYQIAVDIGGTFTDAVVMTPDGAVRRAKALTTPSDYTVGIIAAIEKLAKQLDLTLEQLLAETSFLVNGTTIVTNTIAQLRGRKVGLLVTKGFEDILKIARCPRIPTPDPFAQAAMPVVVPRDRIVGIPERVDRTGRVVTPLDEEAVRHALGVLVEEKNIEALAICYLWSFANQEHERCTRDIAKRLYPHLFVTASCDIYPVIREYERMVTTVLNCFVSEVVNKYLEGLESAFRARGLKVPVHLGQSLGGILDVSEAASRPLHLFNSGPVGGVMGSTRIAKEVITGDVLTADMGGTSFDVALIRNEQPDVAHRAKIDRFETGLGCVDIVTIGAGGGSICWLDERGAPRVGPHSAGAMPGPICYGRAGQEPTVTDVAAALGLLDPEYFLGGTMRLDVEAAKKGIDEKIAKPLGGTWESVAPRLYEIIVSNMLAAVRKVSLQRGHDPRELTLMAYGGASGLFMSSICEGIGIRKIIIPNNAAAFSALGLLSADAIRTEVQTVNWLVAAESLERVNKVYEGLASRANANLKSRGYRDDQIVLRYEADMRFAGQVFDVTIEIPARPLEERDRDGLEERFKLQYALLYGPGSVWEEFPVTLVNARVLAYGLRTKPSVPRFEILYAAEPVDPNGKRHAFLPSDERWEEVAMYYGQDLLPGSGVAGPAIVEDVDTTILVPRGAVLARNEFADFVMTLGQRELEYRA